MPPDQRPPSPRALSALCAGEVLLRGRMPWSSNATFLVTIAPPEGSPDQPVVAVYKPGAGERPLWDFPGGLYRREIAAYELSRALGWDFVPETVERAEAPMGPGALQRFVDADFEQHYFTLLEEPRFHRPLKRMATFDVIANNADRKGGHCLVDDAGHIWGIDHGLCFHNQPKLRTVIWDFAGEPVHDGDLEDLERLVRNGIPRSVEEHLLPDETAALKSRIRRLLQRGRLPEPRTDRPYPWPLV
ncbi:MAG TPA: SCO1664 family protein [Acidimicrobiales bacterium]|nr:SCO1664 family protein [Acidimicrobiales bacterium]